MSSLRKGINSAINYFYTHRLSSEGSAWSSTRQVTVKSLVIHRCAAYLWNWSKDIWLAGTGRGKNTKMLRSSFWRFAICQPDHMFKQHFFNKNRTLILENYKILYRKHQLQKLQLLTLTANYKSRSKTLAMPGNKQSVWDARRVKSRRLLSDIKALFTTSWSNSKTKHGVPYSSHAQEFHSPVIKNWP